jgi:hypothetical protein
VSDNGQLADKPVRARTDSAGFAHGTTRHQNPATPGIGGIPGFFTAGTAPAGTGATGNFVKGSGTMSVSKFETFAFIAGFIATGFLTLVALPLAA